MISGSVGLIGLGAIGVPIAHKLNSVYQDRFVIVANNDRRTRLQEQKIEINGQKFNPKIVSDKTELDKPLDLLIVCIKNYSLQLSISDIKKVIAETTIILPLQNGIYAYDFFSREFPKNVILQGYMQGPNTEKNGCIMQYTNGGALHIGTDISSVIDIVRNVYTYLSMAGIDVHFEQDIKKMIWKKMMLNVAGNSVTALTNAGYKDFKNHPELQEICRKIMVEFENVAVNEGIHLNAKDIDDVLEYYITYQGDKHTSMLEDMRNHRKTENEYLSGVICELAKKHSIDVPMIQTLYSLIKIKEDLYLSEEK